MSDQGVEPMFNSVESKRTMMALVVYDRVGRI